MGAVETGRPSRLSITAVVFAALAALAAVVGNAATGSLGYGAMFVGLPLYAIQIVLALIGLLIGIAAVRRVSRRSLAGIAIIISALVLLWAVPALIGSLQFYSNLSTD